MDAGQFFPVLGPIPRLNCVGPWPAVSVGLDEQTAWALVIESAVTAPAVTASDKLLWGHE